MARVRRSSSAAGFTLLEVTFGAVIAAMLMGLAIAMVGSASGITSHDSSSAQLQNGHRRNLEFVSNVLRGADLATLAGFDPATDTAATPRFRRATGAVEGVRTLDDEERLEWRPANGPVGGVKSPGAVWLVGVTGEKIAADRVPQGGFLVACEGRNLSVRLTTYLAQAGANALRVTTTTTISARN